MRALYIRHVLQPDYVEQGMAPTPLGCVWLRLFREGDRIRVNAIQDVR